MNENPAPAPIAPATITTETFQVIDYHEIERLAKEVLGFPSNYNVVSASDWSNDTSETLVLDQEEWVGENAFADRGELLFWMQDPRDQKRTEPTAYQIMSELALRGGYGITWGTYLVRVSW